MDAADAEPAPTGWGREFLQACTIDPDSETDVRDAFESCRASHGRWLATGEGAVDADAYWMLVDAIRDLYGWERFPQDWPWDWPPPILVLLPEPLKNTLRREPGRH